MGDIQTWWTHKNHLYTARVHPNQKRIIFYDDHIAEVERVRYNLEEDNQCLKEDIDKLQARIDELENEQSHLIKVMEFMEQTRTEIKAEGADWIVRKYRREMNCNLLDRMQVDIAELRGEE